MPCMDDRSWLIGKASEAIKPTETVLAHVDVSVVDVVAVVPYCVDD